jgi:hypothetical protein
MLPACKTDTLTLLGGVTVEVQNRAQGLMGRVVVVGAVVVVVVVVGVVVVVVVEVDVVVEDCVINAVSGVTRL